MSVTPCHALSRVTSRKLSRIGHAMSTTPHHTTPGSCVSLFVSRSLRIPKSPSAPSLATTAVSSPMPTAATGGGR